MKTMKFVKAMYIIMALMIFVNLISEVILKSNYSAIALWICLMLFLFGTIFFVNARYYHTRKD